MLHLYVSVYFMWSANKSGQRHGCDSLCKYNQVIAPFTLCCCSPVLFASLLKL